MKRADDSLRIPERRARPFCSRAAELCVRERFRQFVGELAFDDFAEGDVLGFKFFKGLNQRRHTFVLKLMNAVGNHIDENVRILDDFVRLFQIIFSHGCKKV